PRLSRWPLFLSGLILLSQSHPWPGPVRDAATLGWPSDFHLSYPFWHLIFTPFCSAADYLTCLSLHQLEMFAGYFVVFSLLILGWRRGLLCILGFLVFVA